MIARTKGEKTLDAVNNTMLVIISLFFILPLFIVLMTSFVSEEEAIRRGGFILIPEQFDLSAYKMILASGSRIYGAYVVTIIRVVVGTLIQLIFTCSMAYAISKKHLPGRKFVIALVNLAIVFPAPLVPLFLLVRSMGMMDTLWAMIIPFTINSVYLFIMKAFFQQLPESIEEAATIDGCNQFQLFSKIILPLSVPSIATVGMMYAVWHWNEWFNASIFINTPSKLPVQNIMRGIMIQASASDLNIAEVAMSAPTESIKCAVIVISTIPILCIYPFVQKYFAKGFLVGGVKE
ncbi:carbohydrate ABC transporter permease [Niameybacter massiliensis]|uniref:carbohydrate ABC transporter permease n=1 Tax=Niameybacter massiliensis TaxID=1658108 RepID=UPI0006B616E6|nr:carbohydrate ABC transporter permease [Niameybacter massiliensis]